MSSADSTTAVPWQRAQRSALVVALIGAVGCVLGAVWNPAHFFRAYLVGYQFWLGVALGSLVLLMVQYLTGGGWGLLLRRILEAGSRTLPLLALLALPLIAGLSAIYPWLSEAGTTLPQESAFRGHYLALPFFAIRAVVYFVTWLALSFFLNRWSRAQDAGSNGVLMQWLGMISGPGLVLYGITITFASVDWLMSLEPDWFSTIYPPLFGVGQVLSAIAFALMVLLVLAGQSSEPPLNALGRQQRRDLGNLLLTFVMLWAYMSFSQFLLIWAGNLPEEIPWYLRRMRGGWQFVAMVLLVFQFALPFFLLLSRDVKENQKSLTVVAGLVLVLRFLDLLWWVEPAYGNDLSFWWLVDVAAWLAIGGLWLWWFLRELRVRPLLPRNDPYLLEYLPEAVHHA